MVLHTPHKSTALQASDTLHSMRTFGVSSCSLERKEVACGVTHNRFWTCISSTGACCAVAALHGRGRAQKWGGFQSQKGLRKVTEGQGPTGLDISASGRSKLPGVMEKRHEG